MTQLHFADILTPPRPEPRTLARASDPLTSHEAARETPTRAKHREIVWSAVQRYPGLTYRELAEHCELDPVEVMRRLADLHSVDWVYHGERRRCSVGGKSCLVWWPKGIQQKGI